MLGGIAIGSMFFHFGEIEITEVEYWTITAPLCGLWGMFCAKFF
jgi:hypothetical protein